MDALIHHREELDNFNRLVDNLQELNKILRAKIGELYEELESKEDAIESLMKEVDDAYAEVEDLREELLQKEDPND